MSQNQSNVLKFSVRDMNAFINDAMPKLYELGFTGNGNDAGDVLLTYKHDEIPFEHANAAKVLMEKHAPDVNTPILNEYEQKVLEEHKEDKPDLSVIEDKHEEHHEEEHEEEHE